MKKRLLSILFILAVCVGLLSVTALAEDLAPASAPAAPRTSGEDLSVTVRYIDFDESGTSKEASCTTSYQITPNNSYSNWGNYADEITWHVVTGEVSISNTVYLTGDVRLILRNGCNLTITGGIQGNRGASLTIYREVPTDGAAEGKLTVTGSDNAGGGSYGIYVEGGNLIINGGVVTAQGGKVDAYESGSYGIYTYKGHITISSGTVTATGGEAECYDAESVGIYAKGAYIGGQSGDSNLTINGGIVTAIGNSAIGESDGDGSSAYSYGIRASNINISDGTVIAQSGEATAAGPHTRAISYGILATSDINISGGKVEATGGQAEASAGSESSYAYSYGIKASNIAISSGTVNATGGTVTETNGITSGLYAKSIDISGTADVNATGGEAKGDGGKSCGLYAVGDDFSSSGSITISGSADVTANGGEATANKNPQCGDSGHSSGIYADRANITISGGTVNATGGDDSAWSFGIWVDNYWDEGTHTEYIFDLKITGGSVTATGSAASYTGGRTLAWSAGMNISGTLTIIDGSVTAKGGNADGRTPVSCGIDAYQTTITGGTVIAIGDKATATEDGASSYGLNTYNIEISSGTVNATGGEATATADIPARSFGVYAWSNIEISGGTVIAKATKSEGGNEDSVAARAATTTSLTVSALSTEPKTLPAAYWWRIADGGEYTASSVNAYEWDEAHTYVEITDTDPTPAPVDPPAPIIPTYPPIVNQPEEGGTLTVSPKYPIPGSKVTITPQPDEGFELDDLTATDRNGKPVDLTDNGDGTFSFKQPYGRVTISGSFKPIKDPIKDCDRDDTCPLSRFTDLDLDQWYHDGIHFCLDSGLMQGVGDGRFDPDGFTSRAMLITVLYRMEGEPEVGECPFSDVPEGEWYTDAVTWAAENGIVEGYDGRFNPEGNITRQEFAAIMYRYAVYKGYDVTASADLTAFADGDTTADWAETAMSWAVGAGLFEGKGENNLDPTGKTTRAEMAAILYRFCENVAE